jgi:hypothetical protein
MFTFDQIKNNLPSFLELTKEVQQKNLGSLIFPKVQDFANDKSSVPKITGMLVDFSVFEVQDIIEFLENPLDLKERVEEAENLIRSQNTSSTNNWIISN